MGTNRTRTPAAPTTDEQATATATTEPVKRFRNVSPLGALDLPLLGRVVDPGEEFELDDERALHLKGQEAVWEPVGWSWPEDPDPATAGALGGTDEPEGGEQA